MPEHEEEQQRRQEEGAADRIERIVADLLSGRRPSVSPADAKERDPILAAARLAVAAHRYPGMSPRFRRQLMELVAGSPHRHLSRRTALASGAAVAAVAAGAVLGAWLQRIYRPFQPTPAETPAGGRQFANGPALQPGPGLGRWVDVGIALDDLPEDQPVGVRGGAVSAFVVRHGQGVTAMSALCTHLPCKLVWTPAQRVLTCPCHPQQFDLQGRPLPNGFQLPRLPPVLVRVRQGRVEVLGTAG